ncbi:MAG: terminase family protein [Deltaproteobacteria bacterium]|nr:terminase family protein [Deltaproteobacteria bacterium]
MIDGNRIVSVYPVGVKVLYDMQVEERHNYIAGGMVHHNTIVGAYETTCHLTGVYPVWWEGRRFDNPVQWWAAGDTGETVRDIIQLELLGPKNDLGTGMIPGDLILDTRPRTGIPDAVKDIYVKHVTGGTSYLGLKSYDQKRKSFQGTAKQGIWNDEEPPMDVYTEELMRTMTTNGIMINTFTPLSGLSEVVLSFLPGGVCPKQ